jgi:hypothetical protein
MSWPPPDYHPEQGTGYRVTFEEFRQLISDPQYQPAIGPLLKAWFGDDVTGPDAGSIDVRSLHDRIQADPRMQYELYQRAMDLWR